MKTYLGKSIRLEMDRHSIRQTELAKKCGVSQASISAIITSDVRISQESLLAITHCWPSQDANGRILIAHLRDEIHRAGHDPENALDIRLPNGPSDRTPAARDLDVIRAHISDSDVAALIHDIAILLRRADRAEQHKNYPESTPQNFGKVAEAED